MFMEKFLDECTSSIMKLKEEKHKIEKSRERALEGMSSEYAKENMNVLIKEIYEKMNAVDVSFAEEELSECFEKCYEKNFQNDSDILENTSLKEELYVRYMMFISEYVKKMSDSITFGEKSILNRLATVNDNVKKIQGENEKQSKILGELHQDMNIPKIGFSMNSVVVSEFNPKYVALGNVFDFGEEAERRDTYVFTVQIENVGRTVIDNISIENLNVYFCREVFEEVEEGDIELLVVQHRDKQKCSANILPNNKQIIHLIVKRREEELEEAEVVELYMREGESDAFQYDRIRFEFDIEIKGGKQEKLYYCDISLEKENAESCTDMEGRYSVNSVELKIRN